MQVFQQYWKGGLVAVLLGGWWSCQAFGQVPGAVAAPAAPVPPPTTTFWNKMGIPQAFNKARDATSNARGNRPNSERKPPLLRLADPANLNSPYPEVKKAAEIKADKDAAPQKIKAIKYLATVGCGCYPGVNDALLAALNDCTEEVRYAAAVALCQAAGNPCNRCESSGCCNAKVMAKLHEKAYGQDAKGCYLESSAQVREAAKNALNSCRRMHPPGPTVETAKGKTKVEIPEPEPEPNKASRAPDPVPPLPPPNVGKPALPDKTSAVPEDAKPLSARQGVELRIIGVASFEQPSNEENATPQQPPLCPAGPAREAEPTPEGAGVAEATHE
jgi:hypothetical protein